MRPIAIIIWPSFYYISRGGASVTLLRQEEVTQVDPLYMVLYGITIIPLEEDLRAADPGLLTPLYTDGAAFDGLAWRSAQLLKLLMERGSDGGYLSDPDKSLLIVDFLDKEEAVKRKFVAEGIELYFVGGNQYLGGYIGQ